MTPTLTVIGFPVQRPKLSVRSLRRVARILGFVRWVFRKVRVPVLLASLLCAIAFVTLTRVRVHDWRPIVLN